MHIAVKKPNNLRTKKYRFFPDFKGSSKKENSLYPGRSTSNQENNPITVMKVCMLLEAKSLSLEWTSARKGILGSYINRKTYWLSTNATGN